MKKKERKKKQQPAPRSLQKNKFRQDNKSEGRSGMRVTFDL